MSAHTEPPLKSVLFVCTGNTCRSPLAEALFRDLTKGRNDIQVASAGTGAYSGQPASKHSVTLAKEQGQDLSTHRSKAVTIDLVEKASHIFALGRGHLAAILDGTRARETLGYTPQHRIPFGGGQWGSSFSGS